MSGGWIATWWANRPLATKGLVVVAVPLSIFLGSVAALFAIGRMEAEAEQDVRITIAIQTDVNEVHAILAEASSGVRGYLLTGEERFLEPYERAEDSLPQVFARLHASIRDSEAASRLSRIEALAGQKRDGLTVLLAARANRRPDTVDRAEIARGLTANKRVLDSLRAEIEGMQARERELLAARQQRLDKLRSSGLLATGILMLAGLGGSLFAVFLFSNGIVRRVQRLERDAMLLAQGEVIARPQAGRDEIGLLAERMKEASELLRAREQALRDGEERFRLVIEGVRDYGIFMLDTEGYVVSWNTGAQRIKGWSSDEIVAQHFSVFYPGKDGHSRSMRNLEDAVREGRVEDEGWRVRKDGTQFWANVVITALHDETGALRGFSKVTRDITERRRAEEALEIARQEAETASAAKSLFLSRMSHELRTPLNAILGFAQLLELDRNAAGVQEKSSIDQILRAGRHLLALIDEVLDIARIEAGKLGLAIAPTLLPTVIEEAVGLSRPQAKQRGVTIHWEARGLTPIAADPRRLLQVLLNLLSNAIKFNREGGIVSLRAQRSGERVRIEVIDSGVGIEADQAGQLFQPFTRLGAAAMRSEGTGLGLSLSRALVEAMEGAIGYARRDDGREGACFWVELPLSAQPLTGAEPQTGPTPHVTRQPRPATILLIEDNLANAQLIEAVIARHFPDVRLLSAMQARIGLDLALLHQPDLVLLDLHLPDRDGDWVLEELRPALPDLTVILLTADAIAAQADWVARGARAVLTKPIDVPQLVRELERALSEPEPVI